MYFGSVDPASKVVKVSSLDKTADMRLRDYITFRNLTFEGANESAFFISSSSYITIQDCNIFFSGNIAIDGGINSGKTSGGFKLLNNNR